MNYKISEKATEDLENIWLYTLQTWSLEQADRYYKLLRDEIEHIAKSPRAGQDQGHIIKGYLRTRVKSHFIFYKVNSRDDLVEIIRILHQRMDIGARLND